MDKEKALLAVIVDRLAEKYFGLRYVKDINVEGDFLIINHSDKRTNKVLISRQKKLDISVIKKELLEQIEAKHNKSSIIEEVIKLLPVPENGKDGEKGKDGVSVSIEDVIAQVDEIIAKKIDAETDKIIKIVESSLAAIKVENGKDADEEKIKNELVNFLTSMINEEISKIHKAIYVPKDGKDGEKGKDADEEKIKNELISIINSKTQSSIDVIKNSLPDFSLIKDGKDGKDGKDADEEKIIKSLLVVIAEQIAIVKDGLNQELAKKLLEISCEKEGGFAKESKKIADLIAAIDEKMLSIENTVLKKANSIKDGKDGKDGAKGKDADEEKIYNRVQSSLQDSFDFLQTEIKEQVNNAIKNIKDGKDGEKGKDGAKGERGNGIKSAKIDYREHLIISTDDKVIDVGEVGKRIFYSGGGEPLYTNEMPMPFSVGGLKEGTKFKDVQLKVILTKLLYGYDLPFFSSFNIANIPHSVEIGYTIIANSYLAEFSIENPELLKENTISIALNNALILSELPNLSPVDLILDTDISKDTIDSVSFEISAYDSTGTSFNKLFNVDFKYKIYYGEYTEDITDSGFANPLSVLRASELVQTINQTEYLFLNLAYKWFCYPAILGDNYIFIDVATDIAIVMQEPIELTIENEYGLNINYYCYRTAREINSEIVVKIERK